MNMKTKNILRAFLVAIFVLGTMTMYAQSNVATEDNLLSNPGFESPDDWVSGSTASMPDDWTAVPQEWFESYYGTTDPAYSAASDPNRAPLFWFTTTYAGMQPLITGQYAARVPGNATGGMYQVITVTPGETYEYGCDIALRDNSGAQKINSDLAMKILSAGGDVLHDSGDNPIGITLIGDFDPVITGTANLQYFYINRPPDYNNGVKGVITIPAGVTQVRFQIDQKDFTGAKSPVMVWDECFFRLSAGSGFKTPQSKTSIVVSLDPAKTNLTVSGVNKGVEIKVLSLQGTLLQSMPAQENSTDINVSSLPQGFYLLQAGEQALKFIKQ